MGVTITVSCAGDNCERNINRQTGFQVDKGETHIDGESVLVEVEESLGVYCSIECLVNTLGGDTK